jgi:hypothetical protein
MIIVVVIDKLAMLIEIESKTIDAMIEEKTP